MVPCIASTATSTYSLIALVKGDTEYFDDEVTQGSRGGKEGRREIRPGLEGGRIAQGRGGIGKGGWRRGSRAVGG